MPLGIYNVSVSRVCDKVIKLCDRADRYFRAGSKLEPLSRNGELMSDLIDYIELALYAAAEHVDDLEAIATGFFRTPAARDKNAAYKSFQKELKKHKRFVSSTANAIKHTQSRVRLFSVEFVHDGNEGCLHGYFVEGVQAGVVCPNPTFHTTQDVFSITTLVWEILYFLMNSSRVLASFLAAVGKPAGGTADIKFEPLAKAVAAASRLPLYTFGEEHPFQRSTLKAFASTEKAASIESDLYGSIWRRWSKSKEAQFGQAISRFEGDGVTRSFRFVQPKTIAFQHWE